MVSNGVKIFWVSKYRCPKLKNKYLITLDNHLTFI